MSEDDVLEKNPRVSRSALEAIHSQLYGWALSRCGYDRVVAEDLVQQAYVELLTGRAKFEGRSTLRSFVFSVVQNLAKSRFRRMASRLRLLQLIELNTLEQSIEAPSINGNQRLWRSINGLPQRQRDVVELVFCRDMSIEDASRVMGVSVGTARTHYDRAKKTLRARLKDEHGGEQ